MRQGHPLAGKASISLDEYLALTHIHISTRRNGLGQVVAHQAMTRCIEKARTTGLAAATVRNSNHFGVGGYLKDRVTFITDWVNMGDAAIVIPIIILIGLVLAALSASFAIRRWLRA